MSLRSAYWNFLLPSSANGSSVNPTLRSVSIWNVAIWDCPGNFKDEYQTGTCTWWPVVNMDVEHEINILKEAIKEIGTQDSDGTYSCTFGKLYEATVDTLEVNALQLANHGPWTKPPGHHLLGSLLIWICFHVLRFSLKALNGTLRAAKRTGVIDFKGQMLLKGANDAVIVKLLKAD